MQAKHTTSFNGDYSFSVFTGKTYAVDIDTNSIPSDFYSYHLGHNTLILKLKGSFSKMFEYIYIKNYKIHI